MAKKLPLIIIITFSCLFGYFSSFSQTTVKGKVSDGKHAEPLIGVNILIKNSSSGTLTDIDGNFTLETADPLPLQLQISYLGFKTKEVEITDIGQMVEISLEEDLVTLEQIVVTASKVEESIVEAAVTIEKLEITELRNSASADAYGAIANLKGVQANTGSLTFTSINTRGFADMQNFRFVQLLDGMDASAPGLNYPLGGNSGPADIDIASIELVPGANSALYGANAFNGLLSIKTKNPFYDYGVSAYTKVGATSQDAAGTNGYFDVGFRAAHVFSDKFAAKFSMGYVGATDWAADDDSHLIGPGDVANKDDLLDRDRDHPNYNAVNVYGDELEVDLVNADGTKLLDTEGNVLKVNRTGIKEEDIVDYDISLLKLDGSLHYKVKDDIEASYAYRYIQSDGVLRHTTIYPLVNFTQQFHRVGVKGSNFDIKAFYSLENAEDSYALLATGTFIEQARKSNAAWGTDYSAALRGDVADIAAGDHSAARMHADRDLISLDSAAYQNILDATLNNSDITTGGSKFIDKSSLYQIDGNYDFKNEISILDVQIGGNYRSYKLDSEGQLFNDGPNGFNEPIKVDEFGFYTQVGKKLLDDRLNLRGSLRLDKNQNFDAKITPRVSAVYSLDENKKNNIRASYQTGFRNPASQEAYIALNLRAAAGPATPAITLIGGLKDNFANYNLANASDSLINGADIHAGLINPATGMLSNVSYLKQEKNTTFELGYKTLINRRLFIDFNIYYTKYEDLIARVTTFSPAVGRVFLVYTNISDEVTSTGAGLGIEYLLESGYKVGANYTYTDFDADDAVKNNPGFLPSFNTPENRFNLSLANIDVANTNFGFNLKYRWSQDYVWQSPFGQGDIDKINAVDLALTYNVTKLKSQIKLGVTNLFKQEYRTVYGGPEVGSLYYISWTYDKVFGL